MLSSVLVPPPQDAAQVSNLLELVVNPVACKARLDAIMVRSEELAGLIRQHNDAESAAMQAKQEAVSEQAKIADMTAALVTEREAAKARVTAEARVVDDEKGRLKARASELDQAAADLSHKRFELDQSFAARSTEIARRESDVRDRAAEMDTREAAIAEAERAVTADRLLAKSLRADLQDRLAKMRVLAGVS